MKHAGNPACLHLLLAQLDPAQLDLKHASGSLTFVRGSLSLSPSLSTRSAGRLAGSRLSEGALLRHDAATPA